MPTVFKSGSLNLLETSGTVQGCNGQWRTEGGGWGDQPPPSRNFEDISGLLDRTSEKNRRLDFLLQFTVFS